MTLTCNTCGGERLRIIINDRSAHCLRDGCGGVQELVSRYGRREHGRVPAGEDCPHTSTCRYVESGNCYRSASMREEYTCAMKMIIEVGK